jgi:hypothetical protein
VGDPPTGSLDDIDAMLFGQLRKTPFCLLLLVISPGLIAMGQSHRNINPRSENPSDVVTYRRYRECRVGWLGALLVRVLSREIVYS